MIAESTVAPIVRDYRTAATEGGSSLLKRLVAAAPPTPVTVPPPRSEPAELTGAPAHQAPILSLPPRFEASTSAAAPRPRRLSPSPAATLRRHRSEPVNPSSSTERRSIFERYWKLASDRNTCCSGPSSGCGGGPDTPASARLVPSMMKMIPSSQRLDTLRTSRSRSDSLPENRGDVLLCYRHLGPPQGCSLEHKEHYRRSNLPSASEASLPPLPVPLQRFYSDGRGSSLRGMYPIMVSPKPILRQSSYRSLLTTDRTASDLSVPPLQSMVMVLPGVADSLNLTRSVSAMGKQPSHDFAGMGRRRLPNFADEDTSETASNTSTSSSTEEDRSDDAAVAHGIYVDDNHHNHHAVGVSFDPRITVTEFDDPSPRAWFTDADLERFRVETVLVAQRYLLQNPAMIEEYNKPRLDPVTGTMRKRALYSLPALSAADASDTDVSEPSAAERHRNSMNELAVQEIQSILVVDRNTLVLDLFRRSLQSLFPHARITTESSGDEAFRLFRAALLVRPPTPGASAGTRSPGFDLVVADERLHQPLAVCGTPILTTGKSSSGSCAAAPLRGLSVAQVTQRDTSRCGDGGGTVGRHVRHASLQNLAGPGSQKQQQPRGCSGSELLRNMSRLVEERRTSHAACSEASPWCESGNKSCPLLIGVSVDPENDGPRLRECGADVIWGKPPPSMDARLRDELVARLIRKRDGTAPTATATTPA